MRNETLKSIPVHRDPYYNKYFMKYTGIDLAKSIGEDFTGKKYTKKEHQEDVFIFLKHDKIIGALKGTEKLKEAYEGYSYWYDRPVNWKNLKQDAEKIIRIPKEQLIYKPKTYGRFKEKEKTIQDRLVEYKKNKYSYITIEGLEEILKRIAKGATLFAMDSENKIEKKELRRAIWYYEIKTDVIRHLAEMVRVLNEYKDSSEIGRKYKEEKLQQTKVEAKKIETLLIESGYINDEDFEIFI